MRTIYFIILLNWFCISTITGQKAYYILDVPDFPEYATGSGNALELNDGAVIYTFINTYIEPNIRRMSRLKIVKMKDGNIIYGKTYLCKYLNTIWPVYEDINGDIYFYGGGGIEKSYLLLLKINSDGDLLWFKNYFLNFVHNGWGAVIRVSNGNIVFTGSVTYSGNETKGFVMSLTKDGNVIWAKITKNPDNGIMEEMRLYKVIENSKGNLVVLGDGYSESKKKRFLCLSELDKSGKTIWTKAYYRNIISTSTIPYDLCETDSGYSFTCIMGSISYGCVINATDTTGNILWSKNYVSKNMEFTDIYYRNQNTNDYFVFGQDYFNLYVFKISSTGEIIRASSVDNNGIFIGSYRFLPTKDGGYIACGAINYYMNGKLLEKNSILKLNDQLEFPCDSKEIDLSKIEIKSLELVDDDNEYIFESTSCKVEDWTDYELIDADIQFEIICETTATNDVSADAGALRLYPNPVSSTLSIDIQQAGYSTVREQTVDITDLLGRKLYTVDIDYDGHAELDTQALPPGMYIAVLRADGHQVQAVKFVVVRSEK